MKKEKGFIVPLLTALITLLLVGSSAYFYLKDPVKKVEPAAESTDDTFSSTDGGNDNLYSESNQKETVESTSTVAHAPVPKAKAESPVTVVPTKITNTVVVAPKSTITNPIAKNTIASAPILTPTSTPIQKAVILNPIIRSFSASEESISSGQPVTLYWTSNNSTYCSLPGIADKLNSDGSKAFYPADTISYRLTCAGGEGTSPTTADIAVTVIPRPTVINPIINSFSVNPQIITEGDSVTFYWISNHTTSCTLSGNIPLDLNGSKVLYPAQTKTYRLTCSGEDGTSPTTADASVTVHPKPIPVSTTNTSYDMGVLVLKYFPTVIVNGVEKIDLAVTGDWGDGYASTRQKTVDITNNLKNSLERATMYLGYKDGSAQPALKYTILDTFEYKEGVPYNPDNRRPLYRQMMLDHDICDYVDNKGLREVWLFAYQGPTAIKTSFGTFPYLNIWESTMAGPSGFYANGGNENMPICAHTYRLYTFNYQRGTESALHSWGHQTEAEMKAIDADFFVNKFQGPYHPQTENKSGRCGSVHNPPNSRQEYDYYNATPQKSDCLDWNPDSLGNLTNISCTIWGCTDISDSNNAQLNYLIWMWQNLPGRNTSKTYQDKQLRNFWDIHGDFDAAMKNKTIFAQ